MLSRLLHDSCDGLSILLNFVLSFLILTSTPSYLRCYSLVLLYLAVVQLTAAISSLLVFVKIMSTASHIINSVCGCCQHWGSSALCFKINVVYMAGMAHFGVLIAFCYCYRYYVIAYSRAEPKKRNVLAALIGIHLPTIAVYAAFSFTPLLEGSELERVLKEDLEGRHGEMFIVYHREFPVSLISVWFQSIIVATCVVVCIASLRLNRILASVEHLSSSSKRRHSQILNSLLWQALLPILYGIAVVVCRATMHKIRSNDKLGHIPVIIGSLLTALSPLLNILFTPPYRNAIERLFSSTKSEDVAKKTGEVNLTLLKSSTSEAPVSL